MTVKPRVVVVTGGTAGVGRATVREFARRGYRVGVLARGHDGLEATAKEVEALGGVALAVPTDVADAAQVEDAAARVERELGEIDVWVNNAMTAIFAPFSNVSAEEFKRVTDVVYLGTVYGTMAAFRRMRPRNRGSIVQVGSALAYRAIPLQSAYCGGKHAIQGFTESLRTELMHDRCDVRLTMVQLPALNTPQFDWVEARLPNQPQPVPPIYQPEVAARAIVWASEHDRPELLVGGTTLATTLAQRVIPRLLDRYLAWMGYRSQQTDRPLDPDRVSNLWEPASGDWGAHGRFDARAHARSVQLWLSTHRGAVAASASAAAVAIAALARSGRDRDGS